MAEKECNMISKLKMEIRRSKGITFVAWPVVQAEPPRRVPGAGASITAQKPAARPTGKYTRSSARRQ